MRSVMALFADVVLSRQFTALPRQCAAALLHTSSRTNDASKDSDSDSPDRPKAVFDKRARSKSAAAQRAAAAAAAASSSTPSPQSSQESASGTSTADPGIKDSPAAVGAEAAPRKPMLIDQFSDPVNVVAKDRTAEMIQELRQASPTGRLLDLFADAVPGAAAEQAEIMEQQAPINLPHATNEHDMVDIILQAVDNCRPLLKVTSRKTGTKINYIPEIVSQAEQTSLAVRWIVAAAVKRKRGCKSKMHECIALELLLAYQKKGSARAKRDDLHKVALENRANVLIKWF